MKTKIIISVLLLGFIVNTSGQNPMIELSFTAIDSINYARLDSIKIMNRTQGGDSVLFWPDTILVFDIQTQIPEVNNELERLHLFQNFPNPVIDQTTINMYVPDKDKVCIVISDILGRQIIKLERVMDKGYHSYKFTPGNSKVFLFTVFWRGTSNSIKILHSASLKNQKSTLDYVGDQSGEPQLKSVKNNRDFNFNPGDELLYIGYLDTLQSGILDAPETSTVITFQFAYNMPCPGTPTVTYEGQTYSTIQVFSQCWLKENLNVGTMIPGIQTMTNNSVVEKYCYDNNETNCEIYGGLYQWGEIMQYTTTRGTQGICPPNWHIPTDEEWKVLEGAVDSQYGIGDPEWDGWDFRGLDVGYRLRTENGWYYSGWGIDSHGFSLLPSGMRYINGNFDNLLWHASFWSSIKDSGNYAWSRTTFGYLTEVFRFNSHQVYGNAVRCVKD